MPTKSFTLSSPLQSRLLQLSSKGISVFSCHTAIDGASGGINDFLGAGILGLEDGGERALKTAMGLEGEYGYSTNEGSVKPIKPDERGFALPRLVTLSTPIPFSSIINRVKDPEIRTVAICAGSGGSVLRGVKADCYLTGEMDHHTVLAAVSAGTSVILCNHSNTERPYLKFFASRLEETMNQLNEGEEYKVYVSKEDRDPLEVV